MKKIIEKLEPLVEEEEEPVIADIPSESEPEEVPTIQKSKKPRTQAQIDAFAKVIEKRTEKRQERATNREKEAIVKKKELEEKILKKAISIKKKEIKKQIALDEVSSDDESVTEIKKKVVASKAKVVKEKVVVPVVPKYVYV